MKNVGSQKWVQHYECSRAFECKAYSQGAITRANQEIDNERFYDSDLNHDE